LRQLIEKRYNFSVPVQYCHFHQVKTVTTYTTKKPKTECGKDLKELILELKNLSKKDFVTKLELVKTKHYQFLNERNEVDPKQFKHQNLRKALRSITNNLPYLFTYQEYSHLKIPTTTNSADGSFGQWKKKIKLHNGISVDRKKQMINRILED